MQQPINYDQAAELINKLMEQAAVNFITHKTAKDLLADMAEKAKQHADLGLRKQNLIKDLEALNIKLKEVEAERDGFQLKIQKKIDKQTAKL